MQFLKFMFATVLFATPLHVGATVDWSPENRCQSLFMSQNVITQRFATSVMTSSRALPSLDLLINPEYYSGARVVVISGPQKTGKTYSIVNGVLPLLKARGIPSTYLTLDQFKAETKNGADIVSDRYEKFAEKLIEVRILAIDGLKFDALSFSAYKALARLIGARHAKGRSTILILAEELDKEKQYGVEYEGEEHDGTTEIFEMLEAGNVSNVGFDDFKFLNIDPWKPVQ